MKRPPVRGGRSACRSPICGRTDGRSDGWGAAPKRRASDAGRPSLMLPPSAVLAKAMPRPVAMKSDKSDQRVGADEDDYPQEAGEIGQRIWVVAPRFRQTRVNLARHPHAHSFSTRGHVRPISDASKGHRCRGAAGHGCCPAGSRPIALGSPVDHSATDRRWFCDGGIQAAIDSDGATAFESTQGCAGHGSTSGTTSGNGAPRFRRRGGRRRSGFSRGHGGDG